MEGNPISQKYQTIYRKIIRTHRRLFLQKIVWHSFHFFSIALFLFLAFILLNLLFNVSPLPRKLFAAGILGWYFFYTLKHIFPLLKEIFAPSLPAIYQTAKHMGVSEKTVRDALVNFIQIYQDKASQGSPVIKNLALEQLYKRFDQVSFSASLKNREIWKKFRVLSLGLISILILYGMFPAQFGLAFNKTIFPWKTFRIPFPITLFNQTGNVTVLKNDPVVLKGSYQGVKPQNLFLVIEDSTKKEGTESRERIGIPVTAGNDFEYKLEHVRSGFTYYFAAEINQPRFRGVEASSVKGLVSVRERPVIRNLQVKITPPSYAGLPVQLLAPNDGEITALMGSRAALHVEADKQLSTARIVFSDSSILDMEVVGHTAKGEFPVNRSVNYHIKVFDTDSIDNSQPVEFSIYPLADDYPYAEIKQPGADVDLEDELILPLLVEMRDDYGFTGLRVKGEVIRQGSSGDTTDFQLDLPYKVLEKGKALCDVNWDLTPFYLVPDDYIQYHVEVRDNDAVRGPKTYQTSVYTIRLPSLLEILERSQEAQEDQMEKVKDVVKDSKELKEKLEEIRREIQKETEMNWEQRQELKSQLEKQQEALDKLSEVQRDLEDMIQKLDRHRMLSPETLEKFFELQKMIEELATPELKEAMAKLQEALEKADLKEIQKAMERFQLSVEQFEKSIERAYELFKRVKLEQMMDELVQLAEKIKEGQQQINEKLQDKNLSPEDLQQLGTNEQNLEKQSEYLEEQIGETNEEYKKLMQEYSELLEEARQYMNEEQFTEMMQQMQQQMSAGEQQQAHQTGEQLKAKMEMLQNMLQMARQNMMSMQKQELTEAMQKAIHDMLSTSFEQEYLAKRSSQTSAASSQVNQIAIQQSQLQQSTKQLIEQLIDISNKTFLLSPQMNSIMAQVMKNIDQSIDALENRDTRRAANSQIKAMGGLNQALLMMQNSLQQMAQASSASGFQEFMEQLQQMAGQQGQLNQETMSMFQMSQQGRLQLSADDLGRLAAQQEMIRQSMEQLSEEMGSRRDVLGRMGELGEEMEEVVKMLKAQRLDRKVIERQERILSRLLDAQKSIREKEYSRKREAEREKEVLAKSPPQIKEELLKKEDRLRRELMESLEEGYAPEYRELIKLYYEALSRQSVKIQ
ncbi:MAG: hypothetical protein Kow0042_23480 [Calditrichia bacterium]